MSSSIPIVEVFSSIQGEGTHVGERQTFVRLQDCELSCKYCDTPSSFVDSKFCRVETPAFSKRFRNLPNPLSAEQLNTVLEEFTDRTLVITGGEPLQKTAFLRGWLPTIRSLPATRRSLQLVDEARPRWKILLETAGIHVAEIRELLNLVDIVAMDLKLPSATGMHPWWREHEAFLNASQSKEIYVKVVVTSETTDEDICRGRDIVASIKPAIPFILQPASPVGRFRASPSIDQLASWLELARSRLSDVRVIPQVHRQLGVV